jgi:hypothetical protein
VLACRREISPRVLRALGLVKVTRYARTSIAGRGERIEAERVSA